ncbi:hypothetical protein FXB40_41875 [Bradyrhizobium rifense]|uniref:Uncharacterized protein n=1 Tax=Bradyrhizobium rifense TaxID=515499 RepID=A0A5D3K4H0_9BRAD|nr:hypothetical protein [Bradyrhizobium rifense]TYL86536.1 hypothetical protein FXB40_41875 [Bradyrhizobium rifense]
MSGYLRFCVAGLLSVGALASAPASSNSLTDIFNTAAPQPAVTSPPEAECQRSPGNPIPGGHWVYRMDGHRKCWFLTEGTAKAKKTVRRGAQDRPPSLAENSASQPRQSAAIDAHAEILRSGPEESSQPPASVFKIADAASDARTGPPMTLAVSVAGLHSQQLTADHSGPDQVDVEQLLAVVSADSPEAMPADARIREVPDEARSWTAWFGVLLMTLGGFSLLSSSRTLRRAVRLCH